jgi:hypothetical protein
MRRVQRRIDTLALSPFESTDKSMAVMFVLLQEKNCNITLASKFVIRASLVTDL